MTTSALFCNPSLPRFSVIVADPAWPERGGGRRGADQHYPVMTIEQIKAQRVGDCAADDAHLWLWATDNYMPDALDVMRAWGFRYIRSFVWLKWRDEGMNGGYIQLGLGQYARSAHEWLLLGSRGAAAVPAPAMRPPSVIIAERTQHSAKPEETWQVIESVSHRRTGPRLELNARTQRPGWTAVGHETSGTTIEQFLQPYRW